MPCSVSSDIISLAFSLDKIRQNFVKLHSYSTTNLSPGFLACILRHLADHGVSVNVASGFYHDHLFVPDGEEGRVMGLLAGLAESVTRSSDEEEDSEAATEHTEEGGHNQDIVVVVSQSDEEAE